MEANERELVRRMRTGDPDAFRELVESYSRPLFKAAWRVLGDGEAAEEAVQVAFVRAWRGLDTFDDRAELATWLYRIAVNAAIDLRRRERRRPAEPLPTDLDGEPRTRSAEPDPYRRAVSSEIARRTREAIAELTPAERTALLLRHFEGRPIAEIARALGKGENATKQTVFRAVRKLRLALGPLTELRHGQPA
jgi:RNA polymerase sigma-70 factor (ECF subfamily)